MGSVCHEHHFAGMVCALRGGLHWVIYVDQSHQVSPRWFEGALYFFSLLFLPRLINAEQCFGAVTAAGLMKCVTSGHWSYCTFLKEELYQLLQARRVLLPWSSCSVIPHILSQIGLRSLVVSTVQIYVTIYFPFSRNRFNCGL